MKMNIIGQRSCLHMKPIPTWDVSYCPLLFSTNHQPTHPNLRLPIRDTAQRIPDYLIRFLSDYYGLLLIRTVAIQIDNILSTA